MAPRAGWWEGQKARNREFQPRQRLMERPLAERCKARGINHGGTAACTRRKAPDVGRVSIRAAINQPLGGGGLEKLASRTSGKWNNALRSHRCAPGGQRGPVPARRVNIRATINQAGKKGGKAGDCSTGKWNNARKATYDELLADKRCDIPSIGVLYLDEREIGDRARDNSRQRVVRKLILTGERECETDYAEGVYVIMYPACRCEDRQSISRLECRDSQ
ncbi:hypothetical protein KM043_010022 [Ampulex compressa]|nr:hypothetical protein KM043_010022 [Ampulex compressa]